MTHPRLSSKRLSASSQTRVTAPNPDVRVLPLRRLLLRAALACEPPDEIEQLVQVERLGEDRLHIRLGIEFGSRAPETRAPRRRTNGRATSQNRDILVARFQTEPGLLAEWSHHWGRPADALLRQWSTLASYTLSLAAEALSTTN